VLDEGGRYYSVNYAFIKKGSSRMKNFFSYFWQSISDFNFYRKIINFDLPTVFKYLLILLFVATIFISLGASVRITKFVNKTGDWAIENLPTIHISDGIVSVNTEEPFRIEKDGFVIIIDTTGKILSIDKSIEQGVLLTRDKLIYKQSKTQTNTYELSNIKELILDEKTINRWQKNAFRVIFPLIFITSFVYYTLAKTLQILFFSFLPLMISGSKNLELKYPQIFKISVFSLTLPFALATMIEVFYFKVKLFPFLFIFIYAVYLVKGTLACQEAQITIDDR
jgi:hypothetical protein